MQENNDLLVSVLMTRLAETDAIITFKVVNLYLVISDFGASNTPFTWDMSLYLGMSLAKAFFICMARYHARRGGTALPTIL